VLLLILHTLRLILDKSSVFTIMFQNTSVQKQRWQPTTRHRNDADSAKRW